MLRALASRLLQEATELPIKDLCNHVGIISRMRFNVNDPNIVCGKNNLIFLDSLADAALSSRSINCLAEEEGSTDERGVIGVGEVRHRRECSLALPPRVNYSDCDARRNG
jgi:hypothetical protein